MGKLGMTLLMTLIDFSLLLKLMNIEPYLEYYQHSICSDNMNPTYYKLQFLGTLLFHEYCRKEEPYWLKSENEV